MKRSHRKIFPIVSILTINFFLYHQLAFCLPAGASVESGTATFTQDANILTIEASNDAIINYNTFNIGSDETVRFIQPDASSRVLNRVTGTAGASLIAGSLLANGIVFLVNPQGIHFTPTSFVNTQGLIASTLHINSQDFLNQRYLFSDDQDTPSAGSIINEGSLVAKEKGSIALLARHIENQGTIEAKLGTVLLASGNKITLSLDQSNLISFAIDEALQQQLEGIDTGIANEGTILADGGRVTIEVATVKDILKNSINQQGIIRANSIKHHNGSIELVATNTIVNTGTLDVSSNEDAVNAGSITIKADTIKHQGSITANANDNAQAGDIALMAQSKSIYYPHSTIEAKGANLHSTGGRVYINSLVGDTYFLKDAFIDVSGGELSGDAGSLEISAKNQLYYRGTLKGTASPGYKGGSVLFDPYDIIIQNYAYDTVFGGDINSNTTADEAFAEHLGLNVTFDPSSTGSFVGFSNIYLQATHDIYVNSTFNTTAATGNTGTALSLDASNDIFINADVIAENANLTFIANRSIIHAADSDLNAGTGGIFLQADQDSNGNGILTRAVGSTINNSGFLRLQSGTDFNTSDIFTGCEATSGHVMFNATYNHNITLDSNITRIGKEMYFDASGTLHQTANSNLVTNGTSGGNYYFNADQNADGIGSLIRDVGSTVSNENNLYLKSGTDMNVSEIYHGTEGAVSRLWFWTNNNANITIDCNISRFRGGYISAQANGNVIQKANSTILSNTSSVLLYADADNDGIGYLFREEGSIVNTTGTIGIKSASDINSSMFLTGTSESTGAVTVYTNNDFNITIDSSITRANKSFSFYSKGSLTQTAAGNMSAGTGNILMYADYDSNGIGTLTLDPAATFNNSGELRFSSASDLATSTLLAGASAATGHLYVNTTTDYNISVDSDITRTAKNLYFYSNGSLAQSATSDLVVTSGNIYFYADNNNNSIGTLTRAAGSTINSSGTVLFQSASDLATSTLLLGSDNVSGALSVYTTGDYNITIDSDITRSAKNLYFYSTGDVGQAAGSDLKASTGNIYLYADTNSNGSGVLTRDATSTLNNSGEVRLSSASDLTSSVILVGTTVATGHLYVATTADFNITVDSDITRTNKNISFSAGGNCSQGASADLIAGTGAVFLLADNNGNGIGTLTRDGTSTINNTGNLSLQSATDLNTNSVLVGTSLATGNLSVFLTSDATLTIDSSISRTNKNVTLLSNGNITQTAAGNISLGSGSLWLLADYNYNGVGTLTLSASSTINNTGNLSFQSGSDLSTSVVLAGSAPATGALTMNTTRDFNITIDSDITRTNQHIFFYSNGSITQNTGSDLAAGAGGNIYLYADNNGNGTGAFVQQAGTSIQGGNVTIRSSGAATILNVTATGTGGDINITTNATTITLGALNAADDIIVNSVNTTILDDADSSTNLTGDWITLYGSTIGNATNPLNTNATTISFFNVFGNAYLNDTDTATLGPASVRDGAIVLSFASSPTLTYILGASGSGSNTINITVRSGDYTIGVGNARPEEGFNLLAAAGDIVVSGEVNTTNKDLILQGSDINLNAPVITGTGNLSLIPTGSNTTIGLGNGAGDFSLTDAEFNYLASSGTIFIGNANTGNITIEALDAGVTNLTLHTAANILASGAGTALTLTGTCRMNATGYIGTAVDPLDVAITGNLTVEAHGSLNGASAKIGGTITPDNSFGYNEDAPGTFYLNNAQVGEAEAVLAPAPAPIVESITVNPVYNFNTQQEQAQERSYIPPPSRIQLMPLAPIDFSEVTLPNLYDFSQGPYLVMAHAQEER
ncbi:MAG: filamentous hemagglutinin N-terminal domain-containing protein [Candidatus Omnitrophica bacterium]|nr:filamentous hemagglutinin N-terminal domain-containing protein [Candidatus Omnitrophota bacterium]